MSRFSWILLVLLVILGVSQLWNMDKRDAPSWTKCKENLLVQTFTGTCTIRNRESVSENLNSTSDIIN